MTHPDLFAPPAPATPAWHEIRLPSGRLYRWRLWPERLADDQEGRTAAPRWAFELEYLQDIDGEWHQVRNYRRRDEVWGMVRGECAHLRRHA